MKRLKDSLRNISLRRKKILLYFGPVLIILLLLALLYEPYMKQVKKLKEDYKNKKQLYRNYKERVDKIPELRAEADKLSKKIEEVTKICHIGNNTEEVKSKIFDSLSSQIRNLGLNLNITEPSVETLGNVDLYIINLQGNINDLKPFLTFVENMEKSGNFLIEFMEIKVEDPNNPVNLQVSLKLTSCSLRGR